MILEFIGISLAAAGIVAISKSSRENQNLVLSEYFWLSYQIIDMHNISAYIHFCSSQFKSEFCFFFAVEPVAGHYYYFWFFVFHNLSILVFLRILEYLLSNKFLADNIFHSKPLPVSPARSLF